MSREGWERAHHWFTREAVPALGLTPPQIAVYNALRDRANDRGECRPSQELIARESGQSLRATRLALKRLVDVGLVAHARRGTRQGNTYRVGMKPAMPTVPPFEPTPRRSSAIEAPDAAIGDRCDCADARDVDDIAAPGAGHCGTTCRSIAAPGACEEDPVKYTHEEHPVKARRERQARRTNAPTRSQFAFIADIRRMVGDGDLHDVYVPRTRRDADLLIREYWPEVARRVHNGEPFGCSIADLSPRARGYVERHDLETLFEPHR